MKQDSYNSNSLGFDQPQPPHTHPSKRLTSFCYNDDDEDYTSAITPDEPILSTEEPDNSLSMGDEHLDTIPATESDEVIKSSVENLIPILSESEGIPEHMCDVPSHDNSSPLDVSKDQIEDFSQSNDEVSSTDNDSFSFDNIDYVEASPPDSELVSSEVMEIVIPEVGGIDDDILLTIKDDILREKLLNVNLFIAKIEALNANPTPSFDCKTKSPSTSINSLLEETNTFDNSLLEFETSCFEISSGSPTTHSDSSLYASLIFDLSINPFSPADRSIFLSSPMNSFPSYRHQKFSSTDDDSFSFDKIDYVEASPPDSELVSSEVMEIVILKVGGIEASNDNPILFYDPIISRTPLTLTASGESNFFLEVDAFLAVEDEPTSSQLPESYLDPEGDMLLLEAFLNDDHSSDFKTKSSSTSLNSLLKETNNFDNSLPEFTTFLK
nr:hypothetical protein [Tanacetum cinerariifolium]